MPQSLACILVHMIFSTKNRVPVLTPEIQAELHRTSRSYCGSTIARRYRSAASRTMFICCLAYHGLEPWRRWSKR